MGKYRLLFVNPIDEIIQKIWSDNHTKELIAFFEKDEQKCIQLGGLAGSFDAFLMGCIYRHIKGIHLIIASDKEKAAYLQNTISSILEPKEILFLPDSFKKPGLFAEIHSNQVLQRTEVINKISSATALGEIIITYPEALFEKVIAPEALAENKIHISINEPIDIGFLVEVLLEYGFEKADFVYEPGQFATRGGIIDIFSYGNEYPYRVELFDETVESIRTFEPSTQLSNRNISQVTIIPNVQTQFSESEKVSFLSLMPTNTTIWLYEYDALVERLQICFEKAEEYASLIKKFDASEIATLIKERAFIRPFEISEAILEKKLILMDGQHEMLPVGQKINFNIGPQPSFNKNFNLLIEDLKANSKVKINNYIFIENAKQVERFYAIFEDLNAKVDFIPVMKSIHHGFICKEMKVACYTDHQIFQRHHSFKLKQGFSKDQALSVRLLKELQPGDFVTHIDHGIGKYSGLQKIEVNGQMQEAVRLIYQNNDVLYVSIISLHKITKYVGREGTEPRLNKLGSESWKLTKEKSKRKIKDIAGELIKLYAKRRASVGHAFPPDGYLQTELEASFFYEDTPDQFQATIDTKSDMEKEYPMDRLICGDVGFGKTEIAIRAAFKAASDGKQVAILVPTTILALQHYKTFSARLEPFACTVEYVNRFKSAKQKKEIFQALKDGKIDIVIGTHAILNKDVGFKDLGLLIIDEEQKFGVASKEKLRSFKVNIDTLTLTATPIPRTLQFSLMSARDLSIIRTPPPNRQPIQTEIKVFSDEVIKEAIYYEVARGGQVFFVHNRVQSLMDMSELIQRICPDVSVVTVHGQMDPAAMESALLDFIEGQFDVLMCTNIIETGLDIPNVNTIIINNAHQFGLSDLHQLRGRVGRSNRKAYCYLFCPPMSVLTTESKKRLKTIEEFNELGSGFQIAMRDLDIRGAGNLLGGEQSGFMVDIGYDAYHKILEEAIFELKSTEFKDVFKEDLSKNRQYIKEVQVDTDVPMMIPDQYVSNIAERLSLYTELDELESEEELDNYSQKMKDRFGKIPVPVLELFEGLRIRWLCKKLGFERLLYKNKKLQCYFISNPQSSFYETEYFGHFIQLLAQKGNEYKIHLKQSTQTMVMIKDQVPRLRDVRNLLMTILEDVNPEEAAVAEKKIEN